MQFVLKQYSSGVFLLSSHTEKKFLGFVPSASEYFTFSSGKENHFAVPHPYKTGGTTSEELHAFSSSGSYRLLLK